MQPEVPSYHVEEAGRPCTTSRGPPDKQLWCCTPSCGIHYTEFSKCNEGGAPETDPLLIPTKGLVYMQFLLLRICVLNIAYNCPYLCIRHQERVKRPAWTLVKNRL